MNSQKVLASFVLLCGTALSGQAQSFTVQVGTPAAPPTPLVAHGDSWHYRKGTNAPQADWKTAADAALDATWLTGNGGFGYADNTPELTNCRTILRDMAGPRLTNYLTVPMRKSFQITSPPDASQHLLLTMDWDDGFIAWLDGNFLASSNSPAPPAEPAFNATATAGHESSHGTSPNPAVKYDLGPVGSRLDAGTHVLAILGLNAATNSSDFVQIADLGIGASAGGTINGTFLSIVKTNSVTISGTNTYAGSVRVTIDGSDAAFDAGSGAWSKSQALNAGFNRLLLQALDASGVPLYSTNVDVVLELSATNYSGTLPASTTLNNSHGIIHVTGTLHVPAGGTLTIEPGTVFLVAPGASLLVTNGTISAAGTEDNAIYFFPNDGASVWGEIAASGTGSHLALRHCDVGVGHVELFNGAVGDLEDSYFHDYTVSSPAIIHTLGQPNHVTLNLRRCHIRNYYEILSQAATNHIEDCLCEEQAAGGDGIDFDWGQPGSYIRRCTVRHGRFTNIDAVDMGELGGNAAQASRGILVDSCLLYDFVDKGVSMGVNVDVTVSNCFIHSVDSAVAVKDLSIAGIYNCTFMSNLVGFNCYNKANPAAPNGGGFITNSFNNILWDNDATITLLNGSTLTAHHSDLQNTNWPGVGNIDADPLFLNARLFDCRVPPNSPTIGAGQGGENLGAHFPVGSFMALSHPRIDSIERDATDATRDIIRFWVDSEKTYTLQYSDIVSGGSWVKVADLFPHPLPRRVAVTNDLAGHSQRFYRLLSPRVP